MSKDCLQFLTDSGVDYQFSSPHTQHQNGMSEKFVDTLGSGMRTLLLQSGLPSEFWGAACHYYTDVYNHLPHSSINFDLPITKHTGIIPDVSWFRAFGCRAVIFQGRDLVEHHKLAPRGEAGVFIGLGMSHGRRCWLIWSPRLNRVFATRNATFDDTLFPLRLHDQRAFGYYDNQPVTQMRADAFNDHWENYTNIEDVARMPFPAIPLSNEIDAMLDPFTDEEILRQHDNTNLDQFSRHPAVLEQHAASQASQASTEHGCDDDSSGDKRKRRTAGESSQARGGPRSVAGGGQASQLRGGDVAQPAHSSAPLPGANPSLLEPSGHGVPSGAFKKLKRTQLSSPASSGSYGQTRQQWWHVEQQPISQVTDAELAEYLIGHSIKIPIPQEYWPAERRLYGAEAFEVVQNDKDFPGQTCLRTLLYVRDSKGQRRLKQSKTAVFPVSKPINATAHPTDVSIRRAIALAAPRAQRCLDLTHAQGTKQIAMTARQAQQQCPRYTGRSRLHARKVKQGAALLATATMCMLMAEQTDDKYKAVFHELCPKNWREARSCPQSEKWLQSEEIEIKKLWDKGTWEIVDTPAGVQPLRCTTSYKVKTDKNGDLLQRKARVCADGSFQFPWEYNSIYSPTVRFTAVRTLLALAAQENYHCFHFDIEAAFVSSDIDRPLHMNPPPGYSLPKGKCLLLNRSLYGLRQSSAIFYDNLSQWLLNYGFEKQGAEDTLFKLCKPGGKVLYVGTYVDDGICCTNDPALYRQFLSDLSQRFALSDQGELSFFLGVAIDHDRANGTISLSQEKYVDILLDRFSMTTCDPAPTPLSAGAKLLMADQPAVPDPEQVRLYQQLVGGLMYASTLTRPDIAFAVSQCARFMANPGPQHVQAAKQVLRYLKGTKHKRLTFRRQTGKLANTMISYADADHAACLETRRSVTGYIIMLNGAAVSWQSKRQQVTALSTAEAEYYAASICACEIIYLRRILEDMGFAQAGPTTMWEDNAACIHMSETSVQYNKARHIDTRVYRLREIVKDGDTKLYKIKSADQTADSLTKSTPRPVFEKHRMVMMGERDEADADVARAALAWAAPDVALCTNDTGVQDEDVDYPWWTAAAA